MAPLAKKTARGGKQSSFFLRKGKKTGSNVPKTTATIPNFQKRKRKLLNEELESGSDEEITSASDVGSSGDESEVEQTPKQKRLRITKELLKEAKERELEDLVLEKDVGKEGKGPIVRRSDVLQSQALGTAPSDVQAIKGHKLSLTAAVITSDKKYMFSASKDGAIFKYGVTDGKLQCRLATWKRKPTATSGDTEPQPGTVSGHTGSVLCLAISTDGTYLASGGSDKLVVIWSTSSNTPIHSFRGHKKAITGLTFRAGTHQLFSVSADRCAKHWNVDERAYIETLFGHEDTITGVACGRTERPVTCGGRDNSVRVWKIVDESQLVFNGPKEGGSIDCVAILNDVGESFVSGADSGELALWSLLKKKAVHTVPHAHGVAGMSPRWITAAAALPGSDVVASGSCDGFVRLWKVGAGERKLSALREISVPGTVNSLMFSADGSILVASVGQEPRLGRWWRNKEARNALYVIKFAAFQKK